MKRLERRGSLLCLVTEWWLTAGWNGHCRKSPGTKEASVEGQRRIKVMYPAMALGNPMMALLLVSVKLGTTHFDDQPSL